MLGGRESSLLFLVVCLTNRPADERLGAPYGLPDPCVHASHIHRRPFAPVCGSPRCAALMVTFRQHSRVVSSCLITTQRQVGASRSFCRRLRNRL